MLENCLPVNKFLSDETGCSQHCKASVLDLLDLHGLEFLGILRAEPERVETNVPGGVVIPQEELVVGRIGGRHPTDLGPVDLSDSDGEDEYFPEGTGNLGEVVDGGAADLGVEE